MSTTSSLIRGSPKDRERTNDDIKSHSKKVPSISREVSKKSLATRLSINKPSSSIPLPVKSSKGALQKPTGRDSVRTISSKLSKPSSAILRGNDQVNNKHTLEIQFLNKRKQLAVLKKELNEKKRTLMSLYKNLVLIKKRLEELGKVVYLEEVKWMSYDENSSESRTGGGESLTPEAVAGMQKSIEEIPKTLMDICMNLLGRRNVIVELLESLVKSEINMSDLNLQIDALRSEGTQLQHNLDIVIAEHRHKVKGILHDWQLFINDKRCVNTNIKIEDLEDKLKIQKKLVEESNHVIQDLQRKLDDRRSGHDRYVTELNNTIHELKEAMQKMEIELESERKAAAEFKNRNNTNAQSTKILRNKIAHIENEKKESEAANIELNRKIKLLNDSIKYKETQWAKEKEELTKSLRHQETMLQKLKTDKSSFETRLETVEEEKSSVQVELITQIENLKNNVDDLSSQLDTVTEEKNEAVQKCREMEEHISKIGLQNRDNMCMVTNSIEWGKGLPRLELEAQRYSESMVMDIMKQEYEDKIKNLEEEITQHKEAAALLESSIRKIPEETENTVTVQRNLVVRYKKLLVQCEEKLQEKSNEVRKLTSEIRQLKLQQEHLEELNLKCPSENLQQMIDEGRSKLGDLMKKSLESEQKILHCETVIDKQNKQMNEMENLLRYRDDMAGVLKASRDELILEKESLTRYCHEMRTVLAEVSKEGKMKDRLIKELQEKIDLREQQISKLEKDIRELKSNLMMTNEKRFKLQETIGTMEKEIQSTKAHANQLADINTRYEIGIKSSNSSSVAKISSLNHFKNIEGKKNNLFGHSEKPSDEKKSELDVSTSFSKDKMNSRSLISLSLKQVDFLRSRLNYLKKVNVFPVMSKEIVHKPSKTQTLRTPKDSDRNLIKIVELTAKRYEFLQKQAYESYEELTNLVKLTMSTRKLSDK